MVAKTSKKTARTDALTQLLATGRASVQEISLNAIDDDPKYQCRIETSMDHVRLLGSKMDDGKELDPIVLFRCTEAGRYILSDGFHRVAAHKKARRLSIRAWVIESDDAEREAFLFGSEANFAFASLQPSADDKKKILQRFLLDEQWQQWSDSFLSRKVGMNVTSVKMFRCQLYLEHGIALPVNTKTIRPNGSTMVYAYRSKQRSQPPAITIKCSPSGKRFQHACNIGDKRHHLGMTSDGVNTPDIMTRYNELVASKKGSSSDHPKLQSNTDLSHWLVYGGISAPLQRLDDIRSSVVLFRRTAAIISVVATTEAILALASKLWIYQRENSDTDRLIITGYSHCDANGIVILWIAKLRAHGIEFMTPEELFVDLQAQQAADPESETS